MNLSLLVVVVVAATIQCTNAQCGDLQYLNTTSNECLDLSNGKKIEYG